MQSSAVQIGIDIGGTFTDVVGVHNGGLLTAKIPSTPRAPEEAVFQGIESILAQAGTDRKSVTRVVHGTTIATNAALEKKGVRVGFITTKGFEDIIEIGRLEVSNIYDLTLPPETPIFIAPKHLRMGIAGRVDAEGKVVTELDEAAVEVAVRRLVEEEKVGAIAIGFLFSFLNRSHEERAADIARRLYPALPVSMSCDIDPRFREYERFSTTLFDAYLRPLVAQYLERVESGVKQFGDARFYVMQSSGGLCTVNQANRRSVALLKSGLAGGVNGACAEALTAGFENIISVDIGGTSCDVALVSGGKPVIRPDGKLETYPLRVPMIDVNTIGAGGGSIAWIDAANGLHVGPQSAGSEPGPACYNRGGTDATVTDASIVLGYLDPNYFAGGKLALKADLAHAAVGRVAEVVGLSEPATAWGIHRILNAAMTDEIRKVSMQRGEDPREFVLILLGGGGPVHGCELARDIGIKTLVVPAYPGLLAAYGLLVSSVTKEGALPFRAALDELEPIELARQCDQLDELGRHSLRVDGANSDEIEVTFFAQARYVGQSFELEIELPADLAGDFQSAIRTAFEDKHRRIYGRINSDRPIEITSIRSTHFWPQPTPPRPKLREAAGAEGAHKGSRSVYNAKTDSYVDTPVYERERLWVGATLTGPAIIEQLDTTTIVPVDATVEVHRSGALIIKLETGEHA